MDKENNDTILQEVTTTYQLLFLSTKSNAMSCLWNCCMMKVEKSLFVDGKQSTSVEFAVVANVDKYNDGHLIDQKAEF